MVHRNRQDFRHSRGEFGRVEHRFYGQQSQSSRGEVVSPFGNLPRRQAGAANRQFAGPLSAFFGVRPEFADTRRGMRQEARYDRALSAATNGGGPLGSYLQQAGQFLPQVFGQAQDAGQRIASMAPGLFDMLKQQVQTGLNQLPGIQQGAANQSQQAQNFLNQAASPIANQALYQNALRQGLEGQRSGAQARGLLDAGSAQAGEETFGRDLAAQFAQNQFANQQQALGGVQNALGAQAGLLPVGAQLAGALSSALPGLQQALQAGYQTPMDALSGVFQAIAAGQNPQLALLSLTAPQVAQRSSGGGFNVL